MQFTCMCVSLWHSSCAVAPTKPRSTEEGNDYIRLNESYQVEDIKKVGMCTATSISDSHAVVLVGRTTTSVWICSVWSLPSCCPIPILEGDSATHLRTERERSGGRVNRSFSSVFSGFIPMCLYLNIFVSIFTIIFTILCLLHVSTHCRILMHIITFYIITRLECTPCTYSMLTIVPCTVTTTFYSIMYRSPVG